MAHLKAINYQKNLSGMKELQDKVKKAKAEKKIFVLTLRYEAIRQGLLMRNWLEKVMDDKIGVVNSDRLKIAMLLKNSSYNFIWQTRGRPIKSAEDEKPFLNSILRQPQFDFTRKDGLTSLAGSFRWNHIEDLTDLQYQRSHILNDRSTKEEFLQDFRCTAFTSFILFLNDHEDIRYLFTSRGEFDMECVEFSLQKVELLLKFDDHDDLDTSSLFDVCAMFPKNQKATLEKIKQITSGKKKFRYEDPTVAQKYKELVKDSANKILTKWPHFRYDGFKNLWVFKPLGSSSGNGVIVLNDEEKIRSQFLSLKMTTYVAQKYIERPMLIHERKFDIRIYFMTFIRDKFVHIWLYKDCYIKFATHSFTCDNFNKSIHVTNYAVQKHFMNASNEVPGAKENMWKLTQLINYFQSIDKPRLWEAKIYPAIKKNLLAVILPSLEGTELTHNNFELNGADFMIGFDHEPILIEINSVPALFFSRSIVQMITNKLLDDILKVVVDQTEDPNAYVGDFELIHSQQIYTPLNEFNLSIDGKKLERTIDRSRFRETMMKVKKDNSVERRDSKIRTEFETSDGSKYVYIKQS